MTDTNRTHVDVSVDDSTQPSEAVKVARDLREIERLTGSLSDQAQHRAAHKEMPGGKAMAMMAPVANHEAFENQIEAAERIGQYPDLEHESDDWEPPLQTLTFWSEQWREERGKITDRRFTVESEARFLRESVDWAYDNAAHWDDFRKSVRVARLRLEDELADSTRAERTQTPCLDDECGGRRLIKVWQAKAAWDFYKCTRCKRRYDHSEYTRARHQHLASAGAERFVKIQDAVEAIKAERSGETVRKWYERGDVSAICDRVTHQVYVWWPDVRRLHVETPTRKRGRSA